MKEINRDKLYEVERINNLKELINRSAKTVLILAIHIQI